MKYIKPLLEMNDLDLFGVKLCDLTKTSCSLIEKEFENFFGDHVLVIYLKIVLEVPFFNSTKIRINIEKLKTQFQLWKLNDLFKFFSIQTLVIYIPKQWFSKQGSLVDWLQYVDALKPFLNEIRIFLPIVNLLAWEKFKNPNFDFIVDDIMLDEPNRRRNHCVSFKKMLLLFLQQTNKKCYRGIRKEIYLSIFLPLLTKSLDDFRINGRDIF